MNKKMVKIISVILLVLMVFAVIQPVTFAAIDPRNVTATEVSSTNMLAFGNKIVGVIRAAGIIVSVIMLMVIGVKYMLGSAEEKAEYKKSLMPYVIGAILLLAASTISGFIYDMIASS